MYQRPSKRTISLVNGMAATSVTFIDSETLNFGFVTNPVTTQGLQVMQMAGGAITRAIDGQPMRDFSATFRFDALPLQVASTTPLSHPRSLSH